MSGDWWQVALAILLMGGVVVIFVVLPIVYIMTGPHFRHSDAANDGPAILPTMMTLALTTTQLANQGQVATKSLTEMINGPAQAQTQRTETPEDALERLAQKGEQDFDNDLDALSTLKDAARDDADAEREALIRLLEDPASHIVHTPHDDDDTDDDAAGPAPSPQDSTDA